MSDRELLEMAAKAAGYDVVFIHDDKIPMRRNIQNHKGMKIWNPLADDGDALRLAVKIGLHLTNSKTDAWSSREDVTAIEPFSADQYKATRRAIVRAAAEIGRGMK